ncbi:response regulator [Candidatus Protochlamydia phocaeensis]|uniref:response regulator n=1 Tax=Candidatus Protochlamydia phocaeensis TaxID=1414722 RepID=UPI000837EE41|nr:response regulator [Candidatus Protochlamydia phocaeensis]
MKKSDSIVSLRFLCISIDSNFLAYLLNASDSINLSFDSCQSIEDAFKKIASNIYDVYLIDLSVSQEVITNLINAIRENNKNLFTIGIVAEDYSSPNLMGFKERENIDFILQKPIFPQQIEHFFQDLRRRHVSSPAGNHENRLLALQKEYDSSIFQKIEILTNLIKAVQKDPNLPQLNELHSEIHKMSGSAGSFGYDSVSILCKKKDEEIRNRIESNDFKDQNWLLSFNEFLQKIKFCFQTDSIKNPEAILTYTENPRPLLFIVDDDKGFLDLLTRVKEQFPIELYFESDPQKAIEKLGLESFNPNAVIVAQKFQYSPINGFDIIQSLSDKPKPSPPLFALLLEKDDIDIRMEAMQKGVNYIFLKPVSAYLLLKSIRDALEIKALSDIKVLILDDDVDFCNFVVAVLSETGINVRAIYDPENLFQMLEQYRPNILLLDVNLPRYDGLSLLQAIRQDVSFRNLIIIIVTSSEATNTQLKAYSSKANDILYKPIDKKVLQNRILNLIEGQISMHNLPDPHDYTGLLHRKALIEKLHEWLTYPKKQESYLILFEIHNFADWIKRKGHMTAKEVLVSIGNQLQWEMDYTMSCFSYNASKFAILVTNVRLDEVEKKIYTLLSHFVQKETQSQLAFDCSITPISRDFENAQQLLQEAENSLEEARSIESSHIKMVDWHARAEMKSKKEVIIVDPDKELLRILKQAFESHDVLVKEYTEGETALKDIFNYSEQHLPSLIIAERRLPDMDGMELYMKIRARFRVDVPFYILTVFSADKDISEGIRKGIREYIVKPFNISIFMQKALKDIYSR